MSRPDMLIMVPTYNERENVEELCRQILALGLDADVLFVDDNSPDGTGQVLDGLAQAHPCVHVVHRPGKLGLGGAHLDGIAWAYERGYRTLVTMDCDFTHSPADIPRLLETMRGCDVAVGSRFLRKGSLADWKLSRKALTLLGHLVTRFLLGNPYDATGAFRAYNLERIPHQAFQLVRARGYAFFAESLFILFRNGYRIRELPIHLPARTYGHSKMSLREVGRSIKRLVSLYLEIRLAPERFQVLAPLADVNPRLVDTQGWDEYWQSKSQVHRIVYDVIASVYRRCVIRRRLSSTLARHFRRGARLLHAGCGAGQVDGDLHKVVSVTAVDISVAALQRYRKNNPGAACVKHASILDLPFAAQTFDGVYNLGVIEHFSGVEIQKILCEFHRVLKPDGRIVIFWPHARASSVHVLGAAHWLLNDVLHRNVRLHAPEPSLLRCRQEARDALARAGFGIVEYGFGIQDFFVQVIVVARKLDARRVPAGHLVQAAAMAE